MFKLKSDELKRYFLSAAKGSTRFGLTIGDIENAKFKFPSLPTQQRIARILSTADAVIEKTRAAIAKYKAIKQGMLHDLFTRGIVSEKVKVKSEKGEWIEKVIWKLRPRYQDAPHLYKESKLGMIPREWEVELIGDCIDPIMSNVDKHFNSDEVKVSLCNYMDVYSNRYLTRDISYSSGSVNASEFLRFSLQTQDVVITKDSETPDDIAVPSILVEKIENLICGYHLCILRSKDLNKLNGEFIMLQLQLHEITKQFANRANGSTRYGLTIDAIEECYLKIPNDLNEQKEIAKRLRSVDNKLQTEQAYLQKMQSIKKGLMEELLSEKWKVESEK
jgi:type I restriction enzyme S subunit